jgi:hypothetical protein
MFNDREWHFLKTRHSITFFLKSNFCIWFLTMLSWSHHFKTGGELGCSKMINSSCSTSGTRRVNLVTNQVISLEWGKEQEVFATSGTYPWSFVTQIFVLLYFFFWPLVLSVLLRFTDSDYHFDIFKLFLARRFTIIVIIQVLGMFVAISLEWGKEQEVFATSGTYPWSFVTQIFIP